MAERRFKDFVLTALKRASSLTTADVILHLGWRLAVRSVEPTHKDGLCIRLRGHEPLRVRWDAQLWVEVPRCICARCNKYDGCPNAAPAPHEDVPGYEGICENCRENRSHIGFDNSKGL